MRIAHLVHPCKELVLVVHSGQEHQLHEGSHCTSSDLPLCHGVSGFPSNLINCQGYLSILLCSWKCSSFNTLFVEGPRMIQGWSKELWQVWRRQLNDGRVSAGLGRQRCTWVCGMFIVGWDGVDCVDWEVWFLSLDPWDCLPGDPHVTALYHVVTHSKFP